MLLSGILKKKKKLLSGNGIIKTANQNRQHIDNHVGHKAIPCTTSSDNHSFFKPLDIELNSNSSCSKFFRFETQT